MPSTELAHQLVYRCFDEMDIAGGGGDWRSVTSLLPNPQVKSRFDPQPVQGLNIWVTFFPAKFRPSGVSKMSTSIDGPL